MVQRWRPSRGLFDAVQEMTSRISLREPAYRVAGQDVPDAVVAAPDFQLATSRHAGLLDTRDPPVNNVRQF